MASVLRRYVLFQIPGLILVSILLGSAHSWLGLSIPAAVGLFLLFVVKDFVLYPYVRGAYKADNRTGAELLIGSIGKTQQALDPEGYVLVKGELWRAVAEPPEEPIPQDRPVRIRGVSGLSLIVAPVEDSPKGA